MTANRNLMPTQYVAAQRKRILEEYKQLATVAGYADRLVTAMTDSGWSRYPDIHVDPDNRSITITWPTAKWTHSAVVRLMANGDIHYIIRRKGKDLVEHEMQACDTQDAAIRRLAGNSEPIVLEVVK